MKPSSTGYSKIPSQTNRATAQNAMSSLNQPPVVRKASGKPVSEMIPANNIPNASRADSRGRLNSNLQ